MVYNSKTQIQLKVLIPNLTDFPKLEHFLKFPFPADEKYPNI